MLTGEMVAIARNERGVLSYQRFVSNDRAQVHVYERYADAAAALAHLENFRTRFAARFEAMVTRRQFTVFGQPDNPALKEALDRFGAIYLRPFGDFQYWA
jgi:quinol monooxygenase YgiN